MKKIDALFAFVCLFGSTDVSAQKTTRLLGGDLSMLPVYEQAGAVYRDYQGEEIELLPWLKTQDWNTVRVRLFVNPEYANEQHKDEGVCQDLPFVLSFARQIKKAGMKWMLDFHYSDTWADPGKQFIPHHWEGASARALADSVYVHTRNALITLREAGVAPDYIQVGNEITNGMLWPAGKIDPTKDKNWEVLSEMLRRGVSACREICPAARLIIHTEKAGNCQLTCSYYQRLEKFGVDYDIIGLSYYPMWHKSIPNLSHTLDSLTALFPQKPIMIVEAAAYYSHENDPWAKDPNKYGEFYPISVAGQTAFTHELVTMLNQHPQVTGLFWWFAEENAHQNDVCKGWLNRGLFDNKTGNALPSLQELRAFVR